MRLLLLTCLTLLFSGLKAQYTVQVQVNVVQPVPPYLPQIKADIAGNRAGMLNQDISSHLSIVLRFTGRAQQRIKLAGSIQRVAPSPMGVSLRPDYQPAQPITMGPQLPIVSLTKDMLQSAFGNFSENSLVWNNMDLGTLRQNLIVYKLPEGTYRVCVTAYDYDRPGLSAPLSALGTGCAYFTICYTAAAPQLILPVSTMMQSNSQFQDFVPHSPQVQFLWTPPATTCGTPVGALNYDLEIRRVFDGQTVTDAQANPYVFHQQNIPATSFFLDTLKYPHVLVPGQKYTIRVKANFTPMPGSPLEIANQGYSQVAAINYKDGSGFLPGTMIALNHPDSLQKPIPIGSILPGGYITESYSPGGVCPATMPITNTTNLATGIAGLDLKIGSFKIHIDQAAANTDGSYKGAGYITWHPFASDIRLKVSFDTLKVNTDQVIYGGTAYTSTDGSHPQWAPFGATDPIARLTGLDDDSYEAIKTRISDGAHLLNQVLGNDEVDFPLGLNTTLGATPVTLAIMGISFKPACTNMNVLLNVNCPDFGGWLSLGGAGFQVDPNKLLQTDGGGVLYLPQDHNLSLGGMNFKFDGCPGAGGNSLDTSKGTYVQWDPTAGLGQIVVNADLQFTNGKSIVAVDNNDNRLTTPAGVHARFSFSDWNDWLASITPSTNFELGALPGFMISSTGGWYDHSAKNNPNGFVVPAGYTGAADAGWQGLYMQTLSMQLPSGLTGGNNAKFSFHNFILDNTGVSTSITANNILTIATGNLGGWAFSIDHIGIAVIQDAFQSGMGMTGGIKIPLSDDSLAYSCNLAVGEGTGVNYNFSVTPKGNYNVNMWAATIGLQGNSSLSITNNSGQFVINATLNGTVGIDANKIDKSLPNVTVTALSFQGMTITNRDPKTNGFNFDPGNWSFGGRRLSNTAMNKMPDGSLASSDGSFVRSDGTLAGSDGSWPGGPSAPNESPMSAPVPVPAAAPYDDGGSQSSADGFSLNFTGFKPYVKITPAEANIGVTFTMNAVLDESGLGIGGSATMDIFGTVDFPKGGTPTIVRPNINLDSIAIDCNLDLLHVSGSLAFKHNDPTFGDDVKGALDLTFLGTIDVNAAAIFGHTLHSDGSHGYNYWGLAAETFWQQGIMFPPGLSLNGLGGGFHYNMGLGNVQKQMITKQTDVSSPEAIIGELTPQQGTLGFDAQAILAYLGPNVICLQPTLEMDFSESQGLKMIRFAGNAEILSSAPPTAGTGVINATVIATFIPNPANFNCSLDVSIGLPVVSGNIPVEFNVGDGGNYLYVGTPAPPGTDFGDPALQSMITVAMGFDAKVVHTNIVVYGYFDIGTQLPSSPYIPPAIQNAQDHDGNSMAQGVINKFTNMLTSLQTTNDNSHDVHGTVNNPGFMIGAGIHADAGLDLVVVSANGSLDIGFAALLEHFDPSEVPTNCSPDGHIGFNNWYAMAMFYADLSAELDVGPFSVGSVNAGAVLTAGLIKPTWASGDIWIDVSALGIISFTGNASINIGSPCSIVKDPLDNIDMIGDFGPRGKSGDNVDVSSLPYVIGNLPLDQDYTVMVNNNTMRTYQFRVDAYDVTNSNGSPLGGTNQKKLNAYEVDILHNEMLCGNATYNAHIRVSAYQQDGKDPNAALVTQDTSFSFTTGPRPNNIQLNNLVYSWPVPYQRYMLKSEFGGQGRMAVAEDVTYLLHPGQPDDCSTNPPPPSPSPTSSGTSSPPGSSSSRTPLPVSAKLNTSSVGLVTTQLLAKFIPSDGGDTLQTTFSYSYNQQQKLGTLVYPIPAGLQNSKLYHLQIWVVPPPSAKNDATVNASSVTKTKTQTVTEYSMNSNHNLVATQVTKQVTDTNLVHSLTGTRQMAATDSARIIFSMTFGTSQYNRFADKMAAYGAWNAGDEQSYQFNMPIYSTASNVEPFDEFEINNFKSNCTTNGYNAPPILHMFNADVPWDGSAHNDQDAGPIYLYSAAITSLTHATVNLGAPETRSWFGIPMDSLVSLVNMPYQPGLPAAGLTKQLVTLPNSPAYINNTAYEIPKTGGYFPSPDNKSAMFVANYSNGIVTMNPGAPKPPPGLLWRRDNLFYNDYMLLKSFADDLATKSNLISGQTAIDLLSACYSCIVENVSGYYGSISMTAESWAEANSSGGQTLLQDLNNFLAQPFTLFPPTPRRPISFTYNFPSPDPAYTAAQASSTFSYKSIPVFQAQVQATTQGVKATTIQTPSPSGNSKPPVIQSPVQAKAFLLTKYNIR